MVVAIKSGPHAWEARLFYQVSHRLATPIIILNTKCDNLYKTVETKERRVKRKEEKQRRQKEGGKRGERGRRRKEGREKGVKEEDRDRELGRQGEGNRET